MAEWIDALGGLPDDAVVSITVGQVKRLVTCGAAICGHPTANVCGLLLKYLISDGEESPAACQVAERLNLIR